MKQKKSENKNGKAKKNVEERNKKGIWGKMRKVGECKEKMQGQRKEETNIE